MKLVMTKVARGVALALALCATAAPAAHATDDTFVATAGQATVRVAQGQLMGFSDRGILTFRGVPYAKTSRFMPPQAPDSWDGVRLAMNYGEICPVPQQTGVGIDEQWNAHRYFPQNENCQFLNIWTPGLQPGAKRPVVVFMHGGGFTNGSSIEAEGYDGRNMSELGDVVFVSLNHRLNVLGTLDLSGLGGKYAQSSNLGMRDIVAALQWVNANIAQFGGDPANVTIVGQSGGGGKVRVTMGLPSAKDLFAKAVVMSGTGSTSGTPKAVAAAVAKHTLANLGLTAKTADKILTIPYYDLEAAGELALKQTEKDGLGPVQWRPTVDGTFIPVDPQADGWAAYSANKPLMIGNVLEEMTTVLRNRDTAFFADNWAKWSDAKAMTKLTEKFGPKAEAIAAAWRKTYPHYPLSRALFFSDATRAATLTTAELKATHGTAPVYVYLYNWNPPVLDGVAGAWHVADVHMAFFNTDRVPQTFGGGEAGRSMSYDMARAWINFARYGNPSHPGLPDWPAYTPQNGATLVFDDYPTLGLSHDKALIDLIEKK